MWTLFVGCLIKHCLQLQDMRVGGVSFISIFSVGTLSDAFPAKKDGMTVVSVVVAVAKVMII